MGTLRDMQVTAEGMTPDWYVLVAREILRLKSLRASDRPAPAHDAANDLAEDGSSAPQAATEET